MALLRLQHGETWQGLRIATPACSAHELLHGLVLPRLNEEPGGMLITPACTQVLSKADPTSPGWGWQPEGLQEEMKPSICFQ